MSISSVNQGSSVLSTSAAPVPAGNVVKDTARKVAVVGVYLLIALLHLVEAPLALLTGNIQRFKLNLTSIKIAFGCLYTFFVPRSHPLASRFDFHHMSYGLLTMLLPGRIGNFGKWITTCSLANYDHFGGFGYMENKHFIRVGSGYTLANGRTDGSIFNITPVTIQDGNQTIHEMAYPADNVVLRHGKKLLSEMFCFWKPSPYLDAVTAEKERIIDELIKPELVKIAQDPTRRAPIIDIDYDLFKNSRF